MAKYSVPVSWLGLITWPLTNTRRNHGGTEMSDNKKYYYLKFKENYFEQDHVKYIESKENGHTYSLILIKLYLKSIKYDGQLRVNEFIPYRANDVDILAKVINHDSDHVMHAINLANSLGIVDIIDSGEMWISDVQNFIGHSSTEAERIKTYRKKLKEIPDKPDSNDEKPPKVAKKEGVQMYDKSTPELELDIETELEKESGAKKKTDPPKKLYLDNVKLTDPQHTELLKKFGEKGTTEMIYNLSLYLHSSGKKYKSHYHTILKWDQGEKKKAAANKPRPGKITTMY